MPGPNNGDLAKDFITDPPTVSDDPPGLTALVLNGVPSWVPDQPANGASYDDSALVSNIADLQSELDAAEQAHADLDAANATQAELDAAQNAIETAQAAVDAAQDAAIGALSNYDDTSVLMSIGELETSVTAIEDELDNLTGNNENLHGQGIEFDASEADTYAARDTAGLPVTVQRLGGSYRIATPAEKDAALGVTGSTIVYSNIPGAGATATDADTGDWVKTRIIDHAASRDFSISSTDPRLVLLVEGLSGGNFYRTEDDISELVDRDPLKGVAIPFSNDLTGESGGYVRPVQGEVNVLWFGAVPDALVELDADGNVIARNGTDSLPAFDAAEAVSFQNVTGLGTYLSSNKILIPEGRYHLSGPWLTYSHFTGYGAYVDNTVVLDRAERHREGLSVFYSPSDGFGIYRNQRGTLKGLRAYNCEGDGFRLVPDTNSYGITANAVSANSGTFLACHAVGNKQNGWHLTGGILPSGADSHINDNMFIGCSARTNLLDGVRAAGDVSYNTFVNLECESNFGLQVNFDDETRTVTFIGGYLIDADDNGGYIARLSANQNTGMKSAFGTEVAGRIENVTEGVYRDTHDNETIHVANADASRGRSSVSYEYINYSIGTGTGPHTLEIDMWPTMQTHQMTNIDGLRMYGQRGTQNAVSARQKWFANYQGLLSKEHVLNDELVNSRWSSGFEFKTGDHFIQPRNADGVFYVYEVTTDTTASTAWDAAEESNYTEVAEAAQITLDEILISSHDITINSIDIDNSGLLTIEFNTASNASASSFAVMDITNGKGRL